jgi:fibronectin-binding autotransporter adhesin
MGIRAIRHGLVVVLYLAVGAAAQVQASVWTNLAGGSWGEPTNWDTNPLIPDGAGVIANFGTLDLTADATVTLDANRTAGTLVFGDTTPSNNWTLSGPTAGTFLTFVATTGVPTVTVNTGTTASLNNVTIAAAQGFVKDGGGTLVLMPGSGGGAAGGASQVLNPLTDVKAGTLALSNMDRLGTAGSSVSIILEGGTLRFTATQGNPNANRHIFLGPNTGSGMGGLEVDSTFTFTYNSIIANNGAGTGGLRKAGLGTVVLGGANTYSGPTAVENGLLSTNNLKDGGTASGIGNSPADAANLVLNGGTLRYTGGAQSTNRLFTVGTNSGAIEANGTGALNLTNAGAIVLSGANTPRTLSLIGSNVGNNILAASLGDNGSGASSLVKDGAGTWILTGNHTYTGTTTINAGTLQIGNGGTTGSLGATAVTNNSILTFNRGDTLTVSGAIAGGGSLNQAGNGTLKLTGANTYTGDTNVNAGTLSVLGTLAPASNLFVNNAATLSGTGNTTTSGLAGNVTLQAGANLHPGATAADGDIGTLAVNGLTVNGGDFRFDLVNPLSPYDKLLTGAASFNAASTFSFSGVPATGSYTLLTSTTPISLGVTPTLNVPTGTRATFTLDTSDPTKLGLTIGSAPKSLTWIGVVVSGGASPWDVNTTQNWSDNGGVTANEKFFNLDSVTFGNVANRNVVLEDTVLPTAVTVNNNLGNDYTISSVTGLGSIAGTATLTKSGAGTLTLNTNNTYTGATTINGGMLVVGNGGTSGTLGAGPVTDNGTLAFNRSDTVMLSGDLTGSGALQQLGSGALTLTSNNSYGATTISAGTLQVGDGGTSGTLGSGGVTNNGILAFNRTDALTVANIINGSGSLQQNGAGAVTLTGANGYTGSTSLNAGTLVFSAPNNLGSGTVINFNGGALRYATGAGNIDLSARVLTFDVGGATIDTNGNDVTFANPIGNSGAGGFTKAGAGTLTLNAANAYAGPTSVAGGTLVLGTAATLGNGTAALNLGAAASAGNLDLTNKSLTVTTLTVSSNSTATPNTITLGAGKTLTVGGNVLVGGFVGNGSTTSLTVTGGAGASLKAGGGAGGAFVVGNQANGNAPNTASAVLNLSALPSFVADYGAAGTIGVGASATGGSGNGTFGALILAADNILTAGTLNVGINNGGANAGASVLSLGASNVINVDNILVGAGKGQGTVGAINFAVGLVNPTVKLRGAAGGDSRVTSFTIGDYSGITAGSSTAGIGTVDFTSGSVDARIDNLVIGVAKSATGTPNVTASLTFNQGTIDVNTVTLGTQPATPVANAPANATLTVAGNGNLIVGAGGVTLGKLTTAAPINGTLAVNGGTATMGADIADGGGNSTLTLNGGTLDLQNHNVGSDVAPIDNLNMQSGMLKNVAQINGGATGLTKTTTGTLIVTGSNGYTGATTVNDVILRSTGSIAASNSVTVVGGTFDSAATQTIQSLTVNNGATAVVSSGTLKVIAPLTITGKLDITTKALVLDYAPGNEASSLVSVRNYIISGGIVSSNAAADGTKAVGYGQASEILGAAGGTFAGTSVDGTAILTRYTFSGDANLSGKVDFSDLVALAQNYGSDFNANPTTDSWWTHGDFNYDGKIDFADLVKLAQNYNAALPSEPIAGASLQFNADLARAFAAVPEPGAVWAVVAAGAAILPRHRRHACPA